MVVFFVGAKLTGNVFDMDVLGFELLCQGLLEGGRGDAGAVICDIGSWAVGLGGVHGCKAAELCSMS